MARRILRRLYWPTSPNDRRLEQTSPICSFCLLRSAQALTGFSPFELVYGRNVRGPLDVLKEGWLQQNSEKDDIINYVNKVYQQHLEEVKHIVQENMM